MTSKQKILVIEDNEGIRDQLQTCLEQDYEPIFAVCQDEAYERLKEHKKKPVFALVLLDLRLPRQPQDMTSTDKVGLDILRKIQNEKLRMAASRQTLPIIVMTAFNPDKFAVQTLIEAGIDYIAKPFDEEKLQEKIINALSGTEATVEVKLAFHPKLEEVRIEHQLVTVGGASYDLLKALYDVFIEDQKAERAPKNYQRLTGEKLAKNFGIDEPTLRQRVVAFREEVKKKLRHQLNRTIDQRDIIDSGKGARGYGLNPRTVRVVAWGEIPGNDDYR